MWARKFLITLSAVALPCGFSFASPALRQFQSSAKTLADNSDNAVRALLNLKRETNLLMGQVPEASGPLSSFKSQLEFQPQGLIFRLQTARQNIKAGYANISKESAIPCDGRRVKEWEVVLTGAKQLAKGAEAASRIASESKLYERSLSAGLTPVISRLRSDPKKRLFVMKLDQFSATAAKEFSRMRQLLANSARVATFASNDAVTTPTASKCAPKAPESQPPMQSPFPNPASGSSPKISSPPLTKFAKKPVKAPITSFDPTPDFPEFPKKPGLIKSDFQPLPKLSQKPETEKSLEEKLREIEKSANTRTNEKFSDVPSLPGQNGTNLFFKGEADAYRHASTTQMVYRELLDSGYPVPAAALITLFGGGLHEYEGYVKEAEQRAKDNAPPQTLEEIIFKKIPDLHMDLHNNFMGVVAGIQSADPKVIDEMLKNGNLVVLERYLTDETLKGL